MKFIIRNLGWVLLIIFFLFMLYLISSQNNIKNIDNKTNTGTISESNIDNKIISNEISMKTISNEVQVENNTVSFSDSVRNFFTLEKPKKESKNKEKIIGVVDEKLIKKVDNIISKNEGNNNKENIIQKVAVKSLFLNDAYFTERLYTVYEGDKLEQLTNINRFGCFKVKVISSKISSNNGKIAWACQKYLKGKTDILEKSDNIISKNEGNNNKENIINENIIQKVAVKSLFLNDAYFTERLYTVYEGDKLEQLTNINRFGCFKVKVISSILFSNNGKIAWACQKYLK